MKKFLLTLAVLAASIAGFAQSANDIVNEMKSEQGVVVQVLTKMMLQMQFAQIPDEKAKELGEETLLHSYRIAALTDKALRPLNDAMRTVYAIGQTKDNREGARSYVAQVENEFKERTKDLMRTERGSSIFDYMSEQLGLEADAIAQVKSYFAGSASSIEDICQAFITTGSSSNSYATYSWNRIKREFILGKAPSVDIN